MQLIVTAPLMLLQAVYGPGCETVGEEVFCPPKEAADPFFGGGHMAAYRNRVEAARSKLREKVEADKSLKIGIGRDIASGNCDKAISTALLAGDLQLAKVVQSLCNTPEGQTED